MEALREGRPVVLPTDTVYGLCADPRSEAPVLEIYRMKQRPPEQPTALLARSVEALLELAPELRGQARVLGGLLPGPYTLIMPNPARRYPWLAGSSPETLGVRVPELSGPAAAVLDSVEAVAATSANLHGGPEVRRLDDVPVEIRAGAAAEIDAGELPGTPSTVLDLTRAEPRVLREGAVPAGEAIERAIEAAGG